MEFLGKKRVGRSGQKTKSYDGSLILLDYLRVLEAALLLEELTETYLHWSLQERSFVKRIPAR